MKTVEEISLGVQKLYQETPQAAYEAAKLASKETVNSVIEWLDLNITKFTEPIGGDINMTELKYELRKAFDYWGD